MKSANRILIPLFLITLLALVPSRAGAHIFDLVARDYVSFPTMMSDLENVRLVFIGELHDHPGHHLAQLQVIRALHEAGIPLAIGLEMFRAEYQFVLDNWVKGVLPERQFLTYYRNNWSLWPLYRDIFFYARKNAIPMVGLNISREITRKVASSGFESLSKRQRRGLPMVRCDVDERYQAYMRRVLGKHVHGGAKFLNFCEAQMVWDVTMANHLLTYLKSHPQKTVVVLAGSGHAWKFGIPEQIRRQEDIPCRVLLPEIPGRIELDSATAKAGDYLLLGTGVGPLH